MGTQLISRLVAPILGSALVSHPPNKDLMSRFTLDSATAYLFGRSVHSLETGLPYPENADVPIYTKTSMENSKANLFAQGFLTSQEVISSRTRFGWVWPLNEIRRDDTKVPMRLVRNFLDPIVDDAIKKQKSQSLTNVAAEKVEEVSEGESLLDHLVRLTSGKSPYLQLSSRQTNEGCVAS